ncbi:helix-turn-helix transcriptional regulator [Amycolatopsis sp. PS_44_ISF1]|uniref:helix-turn-helix transcriptional regulator n=1 Tax=Amycolatopsis sp. PS_44_ISF1 TaxID=2974917 RepID=UPI0028E0606D|nr:helix-turn-helix transcriptional regulator [Amycolatopsis sp. PS_44_ISF1]MDT8914995.1 helix-turn-helix transcriptional regulator [Amycolatopsis sp. PS_44_ISF1]
MTTNRVDATHQLAAFLRARRERLTPPEVGLPVRGRSRRTPGLRREEVAELAGVSTDYIMRLEQARGLRPSLVVAEALARALRLAPDERAYFFGLAQPRPRVAEQPAPAAAPALARLIADLSPLPAVLLNHRYDVLAWNNSMAGLMIDFGTVPPAQRNAIRLCLLHPAIRRSYLDQERVVRDGVAHLRAAWARHPDDRALGDLIDECITRDAEVAKWWNARDLALTGRGPKTVRHRELGVITTEFEVLTPLGDPDQIVVVHRAADEASRAALRRLSGE